MRNGPLGLLAAAGRERFAAQRLSVLAETCTFERRTMPAGRCLSRVAMFVRQVSQEKQCEWLKKQHKKHAIKWHPDKCKGNMQA